MNAPAAQRPSTPTEPTPHALRLAETLVVMAAAATQPELVGGHAHFCTLPPGYQKQDLTALVEKALPARSRKQGEVHLRDVDSLLAYCKDQAAATTGYIYADPDGRVITAVFNDQRDVAAGWRDHRATFKAEYTPEFDVWLRNNRQPKEQAAFAEFIEDNVADIADAGQQMLEVATTIQATTGINFASAKRLQDGQVQLAYTENIDARAGAGGALAIPKEFVLALRLFKNGGGYKLRARLKYRLAAGAVKFWYELDRPERAVEDAFNGYVDEIRTKSGYQVLVGKP
ncbi:MAG: hypothetical protein QG643_2428 [Pseudomonadota bacterium]|nr:hypothetical protein [Pseudomonadota bacterium]